MEGNGNYSSFPLLGNLFTYFWYIHGGGGAGLEKTKKRMGMVSLKKKLYAKALDFMTKFRVYKTAINRFLLILLYKWVKFTVFP